MNYSISEILEITGCELLNSELIPHHISEIYFDTRRGIFGSHALFLAIDSKNADGHQYIRTAYEKLGSRCFLVSKEVDCQEFPGANFIYSKNVIASLQKLAVAHRQRHDLKVIGITGSNGKTIVKEWIYQLCEDHLKIVRSPASYNSQIGVPLSVLKIEETDELGIFEAGISSVNDMETLAEVIQPEIGIFTNIGEAHSAGFKSIEEKVAEKAKLFKSTKKIIYCRDHEIIHHELKKLKARLISWSLKDEDARYRVLYNSSSITINDRIFELPFSDDLSKENATLAIISTLELGITVINSRDLSSLKMRLEMKHGVNNSFLINDAYSSDFNALRSALRILDQQQKKQRNTLILSQIDETNLTPDESLVRISDLINSHNIHRLITVGEQLMKIDFSGDFHKYPTTDSLLKDLRYLDFQNENVLIKGARRYNLEKVFDQLAVKVHQTILEIDLEAMRHNLMVYRSILDADTKIMVVLKASAYGSGSKELSRFLSYQRVDYIAVAYVDEGIELRKAGIEIPIMVMNPEESGFASMLQYDLEPEIYSLDQLTNFASYVDVKNFPIHLKIETGMHRLGLERNLLESVCQFLEETPSIKVKSVFSHLVGSDDAEFDEFTETQVSSFNDAYGYISSKIGYKPDRHILNSNGISRFARHQFEMVRLGIGLHGITDDENLKPILQKVQTLKTRIAQIKTLEIGDSVGYNRNYKADSMKIIGTINIGYADGLPRNAGNQNFEVLINKEAAPIIGNVCMDMCMIDISHLHCKVGDEVVIFGKEWPIESLAEKCGTIPYEILTRLSSRIHRIFSRE